MALKIARPDDRRVLRTRRLLREALIAALVERGWRSVSVQDVCARADVGRSTFYAHFADKEELLLSGLDDLEQELRRPAAPANGRMLGFAPALFEHVQGHRGLHRALRGQRVHDLVQARVRRLVANLVRAELAPMGREDALLETAVAYVSGGFLELFSGWLENRNPPPAAEVEARSRLLTISAVRALRERA